MDHPWLDLKIGEMTKAWAEGHDLCVRYRNETASTNTWAKENAFTEKDQAEAIVVYLTENQKAGRGRGDKTWSSPRPGSALLSSWSFDLSAPLNPLSTVRFGMSLIKAATSTWPFLPWSLKAPNDLYLGSKKVAGLLVEVVSQGKDHRLILGLGMNVFDFPSDVQTSTCLALSMPKEMPLLGEDYVGFLERWLFEASGVLATSQQLLSESERASVLYYLNLNPNLSKAFDQVDADGSLHTGSQKVPWMEV